MMASSIVYRVFSSFIFDNTNYGARHFLTLDNMFDSVYRPTENAKIVSFHPCPEAMLHGPCCISAWSRREAHPKIKWNEWKQNETKVKNKLIWRRDNEDLKLLNQFLNDIVLKWFLFSKPTHPWKYIKIY